MASVVAENEDPFEAFDRAQGEGGRNPYPEWAELRAKGPVHELDLRRQFGLAVDAELPDLPPGYVAVGYDTVAQVLRDATNFSSQFYAPTIGAVMGHSILEMDEPEHHRYRGLIQQAFTRKALERWEHELVHPLVGSLIDGFAGGRADLVRELTFPFPVAVIAGMLGLPDEDLEEFHRLAVQLISVSFDWDLAMAASARLRDYFAAILEERRRKPADDLISVLAQAELEGQRLSDDEIFAFLRLLLPAGAETTYRSSSNLLFGLLTHPDQLAAVRADRSLLPQAIEEGIRWEPPLTGIIRFSLGDVEVEGFPIPEGAVVNLSLGSANRDETKFERPDEFDVLRKERQHLSFALGPHTCLGMHLARMETAVALTALLDRLPGLRFDPEADDVQIAGVAFRSPRSLPVVFDAG